ncbi:MAG: M55 family metallopeptidase [Bacillota bacterium]|jgi:D-amino peptidase
MRRVYISADIEGIEGIVSERQIAPDSGGYERACRRLTLDVNAAIDAALDFGMEEIVVCDGHGYGENLLIEELRPEATLISGRTCPSLQLQGIDRSFSALVIFGHAGAGLTVGGVLDHTFSSSKVYNLRFNGRTINSEIVVNAIEAGYYGVPLVAVIGDRAAVIQAKEYVPGVQGVVVKRGITRYSAESLHPDRCRHIIREGVSKGLSRSAEIAPLRLDTPLSIEIDYVKSSYADTAELVPGVRRLAARTVEYRGDPEDVFPLLTLLVVRLGE